MGTPNYPKDMANEWQKLRREIKNTFSSANARRALDRISQGTIDVFNGIILHAGTYFKSLYQNSNEAVYIGRHTLAGEDVEGVIIRRPNGSLVFWAYGKPNEDSFWSWWDKTGNIVVSDDAQSGQGIARPWLSYHHTVYSNFSTPPTLTSSSTYAPHYVISGYMQHPKVKLSVFTYAPSSGTVQVRLRDATSGTVIAESSIVGNSTWIDLVGNHPNYTFGAWFKYDLEVRMVSGVSPSGATLVDSYGVQS